jgi:Poly (ADP-ribose) glycohydrolase (PARG)
LIRNINMKPRLFNSLYYLPSAFPTFFDELKKVLSLPIENHTKLMEIINSNYKKFNSDIELHKRFLNLEKAIEYLSQKYEDFNFFQNILPSISKSCLEIERLFENTDQTLILLEKDREIEVEFSSEQIRSILSNGK